MSKQIYIDSNGNEVQVSGTVNTADMMPMSGNDSTKVSEAIGDLSELTTSVKSSLVGAVNEVVEYHEYDITSFMVNLYNQIINTAGTTEFKLITIGKVGIINCRFATSSAITSGVGNIPDVPEAKDSSEFRGAISSRDNKSGFIQYSGKTIVIRCDASTNVMAGQVIFALK